MPTAPPTKPLLLFDGDCGFCRKWIERWRRITGDRVEYAPYQERGSQFPQIPTQHFEQAVQLIEPNGTIRSAARAVLGTLAYRRGLRGLVWFYDHVPGVALLSELGYRCIARNRRLFSRIF